jgi:hypothetical protein
MPFLVREGLIDEPITAMDDVLWHSRQGKELEASYRDS